MLVWSDRTELARPRGATPGPTMPSQVVLICEPTVPWFHASVPGGTLKHDVPQLAEPPYSQKSVFPNRTVVGVRFGSAVTICRILSSTGSARELVRCTALPVARSLPVTVAAAR